MSAQPKSISFAYTASVIRYPGKNKRHFFIGEIKDGPYQGEQPIINLSCDWVFDLPLGSYIYVKRDVRIDSGQMFVDMISLAAQTPDVKQMALELGIKIPSLEGETVLNPIPVNEQKSISRPSSDDVSPFDAVDKIMAEIKITERKDEMQNFDNTYSRLKVSRTLKGKKACYLKMLADSIGTPSEALEACLDYCYDHNFGF